MAKGAGGRPTDYTPEMLELCRDYIDNCPDKVPMVVGLCKHINRGSSTVYQWAKDDDKAEFADILDEIKDLQHLKLINSGLNSEFNSAITKMMMTKHGYSEKVQQEVSGPNGSAIENKWSVEFVNAAPKDDDAAS